MKARLALLASLWLASNFSTSAFAQNTGDDLAFQKREALSLQIKSDVETNARHGYGVIAVDDSSTVCVVTPAQAEQLDGIKELLARDRHLIAQNLTSYWQFVDTSGDLALLGLQRRQCGYVAGTADALRTIMLALAREQKKYAFSPVWWDDKEVSQARSDFNRGHGAGR